MKKQFKEMGLYVIIGIIIMSIIITALVIYRHNSVLVDYVVSNDYSYVVSSSSENDVYSRIEYLPIEIDDEVDGVIWKGRIKDDKSKSVVCYKYEYDSQSYLKVVVSDNQLIQFGDNTETDNVYYYIKD